MATLTVTAKGQITLKQELLRHLNVSPGQKVAVESIRSKWSPRRFASASDHWWLPAQSGRV